METDKSGRLVERKLVSDARQCISAERSRIDRWIKAETMGGDRQTERGEKGRRVMHDPQFLKAL